MRLSSIATACALLLLTSSACVLPVIESNTNVGDDESSDASETGDGDGDGSPGDGDGSPGDGDGDGDGDDDPTHFRVVVVSDLHVPGPTSAGEEDYLKDARDRLLDARDKIAAINPPPAFVVVVGDMVHDAYGGSNLTWFQLNANAFADVVSIFDELPMPVYPVFGESDYDVPDNTKQLSHAVFVNYFATAPHSSVDHLGWRFVFANSQEGQTFDFGTVAYDPSIGSFGQNQLTWLGEQLGANLPTVLFSHFPLYAVAGDETQNGPYADIDAVLSQNGDSVELIVSGHDHAWTELPANFVAPHYVLGPTCIDSDNFLLIEFLVGGSSYEILDLGKVKWGSPDADTWIYDGTPAPGP